jgi:hypothetical protein
MKRLLLILSLTLAATGAASADTPGKDWLTQAQVTEKLLGQGYSRVIKLEADDGHWEGDAVKSGKTYEIHVDPHSGAITKSEPKD